MSTTETLRDVVPATVPKQRQGNQKLGTGIWTKECLWPTVTEEDLQWWFAVAPTLQWKWATTFAKKAPHWYLQREQAYSTLTLEEYHRALSVIWAFGRPEAYFSAVNIYLHDPNTGMKYWGMGPTDYGISLINMAEGTQKFGHQRFRFGTEPARATALTVLAQTWDEEHPVEDWVHLWQLLTPDGRYTGRVLDLTARTGALSQMHVVTEKQPFTIVEADRAMLNRALLKTKWAEPVQAFPEDYLRQLDETNQWDTVVALHADELSPEGLAAAVRHTERHGLALFVFDESTPEQREILLARDDAQVSTVAGRFAILVGGAG